MTEVGDREPLRDVDNPPDKTPTPRKVSQHQDTPRQVQVGESQGNGGVGSTQGQKGQTREKPLEEVASKQRSSNDSQSKLAAPRSATPQKSRSPQRASLLPTPNNLAAVGTFDGMCFFPRIELEICFLKSLLSVTMTSQLLTQ